MKTTALIRAFLDRRLGLGELHAELQAMTWDSPEEDELAAEARRVIAEATTAAGTEVAVFMELRDLLERELVAIESLGSSNLGGSTPVNVTVEAPRFEGQLTQLTA